MTLFIPKEIIDEIYERRQKIDSLRYEAQEREIELTKICESIIEMFPFKSGDVIFDGEQIILLMNRAEKPEPWYGYITVGGELAISVTGLSPMPHSRTGWSRETCRFSIRHSKWADIIKIGQMVVNPDDTTSFTIKTISSQQNNNEP